MDIQRVVTRKPRDGSYPDTVFGAVQLSYEKLSDDAKLVADLFAWWAPEALTADLIIGPPNGDRWCENIPEIPEPYQILAASKSRVLVAIKELEDRSLLRSSGRRGVEMHQTTAVDRWRLSNWFQPE
ncbi:hypothetical protein [Actibacterium sp. 188UL27-1]|uniref:hypothetical protein n=1 Tax=Actibacterium sp. 188UL27-1 TaxID=2786961 RepID=UPI00195F1697|nr:hypothetical protein [Actibacterium sp. 188UL27-1]MBM7066897.1 hypothetical protein [Actibacterium sp. 188UL27-1]